MMREINKILIGMVLLSLSIGLGSAGTLTSVKVTTAPIIDGVPDAVWNQATAMTVTVAGGANTRANTVTLKSVYTDDSVYFLATWNDPSESLRRLPWQKQANGSWKQLVTLDAKLGGENTYYEDKFAQIWNINTSAFDALGCSVLCHVDENADVKAFGNKYTPNPGEMADLWHMKMVRTNPTGYMDDQYVDSTHYSKDMPDAGRHPDPGGSPYSDNIMLPRQLQTIPRQTSLHPRTGYWTTRSSHSMIHTRLTMKLRV